METDSTVAIETLETKLTKAQWLRDNASDDITRAYASGEAHAYIQALRLLDGAPRDA